MSIIKLIDRLDRREKTILLGQTTTEILRYTFTEKDTDAVEKEIINEAVALKMGEALIYKDSYRKQLIESVSRDKIVTLGFDTYEKAISYYKKNIERFFSDFEIEDEFRKKFVIDDRKNFEFIIPEFGKCNGTKAFPHPYQLYLKDLLYKRIVAYQDKKILVTMPTGAGKTVLAMEVIVDLFRTYRIDAKKNLKIAWIVEKQELCEQSLQSFLSFWKQRGDRKVMAQRYFDRFNDLNNLDIDQITFATFSLLAERISNSEVIDFFNEIDIVIVDEAHAARADTYEMVLRTYETHNYSGKIVGLTATPFRNDDSDYSTLKGFFNFYLQIIDENGNVPESPIEYLVEGGYLAKIEFKILNAEKSGKSNSEYFGELHSQVLKECYDIIHNSQNCIVFAQSMSHAIALNVYLRKNKIDNELIIGNTPTIKRKIFLERFGDKKDPLAILVNDKILGTGIDVPGLNSIMILGDIGSPSLALQLIGRAMRGKKNGGNPTNTIYLTKDNYNLLSEYRFLEKIVLTN